MAGHQSLLRKVYLGLLPSTCMVLSVSSAAERVMLGAAPKNTQAVEAEGFRDRYFTRAKAGQEGKSSFAGAHTGSVCF